MEPAVSLVEPRTDVRAAMRAIGRQARKAARTLAVATASLKADALLAAARALRDGGDEILAANARDLAAANARGLSPAFLDRLSLDRRRIEAMARGVEEIAALPDPVGRILAHFERPNGLRIERVATPLGVIGVIYESRPNVTADAGALCLKSGNAAVLRGGSDSLHSSAAIHACLVAGLRGRRPAGGRDLAGALRLARRGRRNARRSGRRARCDRAARRQESGRARATRGARPGFRPSRGRRARLCRSRRGPGGSRANRRQLEAAPHRRVRRGRDAAGRQGLRRHPSRPTGQDAARRRLRGARRRRHNGGRSARRAKRAKRTGAPNISTPFFRAASSTASTPRSNTSRRMVRITPIASSPRIARRRSGSSGRSIRRSSSTTLRRNSPTAANSGSAPRSG